MAEFWNYALASTATSDLAIGERTVKTHVRGILAKLGLQDRVQAAIFALNHQADSREHRP